MPTLKDLLPPPPWEGPPIPRVLVGRALAETTFDFAKPPPEGALVYKGTLKRGDAEAEVQETYYGPGLGDMGRVYGRIVIWNKDFDFQEAEISYRVSYSGRGLWRVGKENRGYIERIFVSSSLRGQGLGRWLVEQAESRIRLYGGKAVDLMDHEESEQFWPALGYRRVLGGPLRTKRLK